jgi:ribosomal protein S18 acetylase RimI-like enzyme
VAASVPLTESQRLGLERLNAFLATGGGLLRIARIGGVGVGHALVILRLDPWVEDNVLDDQPDPHAAIAELRDRRSALMTDLLVLAGHRRQGVGRVLVRDAIEVARAHGAAELALFVAKDNPPARRLYSESGFTRIRDAGPQDLFAYGWSSTISGA